MAEQQVQVYGTGNSQLTYKATGVVDGDALQGTLQREPGTNVGTYTINAGTLMGGNDYEIVAFIPATFTITPAPLTIIAENKIKKQGEKNPGFTFRYEGLVNGDKPGDIAVQPQAQTTATTLSPIGNYPIGISGAVSTNYDITMVAGMLTVMPEGQKQMKVWASSPSELQVRIYAASVQKTVLTLYSFSGKRMIVKQVQLNEGINSFTIPVGNIMPGIYIVRMESGSSGESQTVMIH